MLRDHFIRIVSYLLCLFILLILGIAFYSPKPDIGSNSRLLVVFGAGYFHDGLPVPALERRLSKSIILWNQDFSIMISGRKEEVFVMEEYLQKQGIQGNRIITDITGEHTRATVRNAFITANRLKTTPIFISQAYHLPRIRLYASVYGRGDAGYVPTDRVDISFIQLFYVSFRELAAILVFPYIYIREFLLETVDI